jgi:hypothetical protein
VLDQLRRPLNIALIAVCACTLLAGCAGGQSAGSQDRTRSQTRRSGLAPLSEYEATLNPADYDQEVDTVQKQQTEEHLAQPLDLPRDTTSMVEQVLQGFRIQIFASSSIDEATAAKAAAAEKFTADSIYIVFDAPVYKVRAGDFVTRYEANQHLTEFNERGYRDAWVVPDRIVRRSPAKTPERSPDDH